MCVLGVEGSEKKCGPSDDNFWNSPKKACCLHCGTLVARRSNRKVLTYSEAAGP